MANKKQLHYSKVTQHGDRDNMCPLCEGDGVFVGDWEDDGKQIDIQVCDLCGGKGIAEYGKDYDVQIHYLSNDEPIFEIIPIDKENTDVRR